MITIDGAIGEGGGQVLRTSLALALVTGQPCRIIKIRAGRKQPGLLRQHLTAVRAATEVSGATASGDAIGLRALVFHPGTVRAGDYAFAVGTAGSAKAVDEVRQWLAAGVPVGEHLADQLLVPMALVGGRFRTVQSSRHAVLSFRLTRGSIWRR